MSVVTVSINKELNMKTNPWFQVIDDLNSNNYDTVKLLADKASVVKIGRFSNPTPGEIEDTKFSPDVNSVLKEITKGLNLNETQYRNLTLKIKYWLANDFKKLQEDIETKPLSLLVVQSDKISKHEWIFLDLMRRMGSNILVITKDYSNMGSVPNASMITYNTNENKQLGSIGNTASNQCNSQSLENINIEKFDRDSLINNELINAFTSHSKNIKLSIIGTDPSVNTLQLAAKLKDACDKNDSMYFINEKISKPTLDEASKIYRITRDNVDYVIQTMKNFVRCYDVKVENNVKELLVNELGDFKRSGDTSGIIYNKASILICWINRYLKNANTSIVYYGVPGVNDEKLLNILSAVSSVNIIIISADKHLNNYRFASGKGYNIELDESEENQNIDLIPTDTATTMAYKAQKVADEALYGESTIGLYKEGQIVDCTTTHFACTFPETIMWWNREMFTRPGYKQFRNSVEIPVQFGVVRGCKETTGEYISLVQKYCCGKTLVYYNNNFTPEVKPDGMKIHNLTDINRTMFNDQKPFIIGDKLQVKQIKNGKNFQYKFLEPSKQDFILSKIQEIIDDNRIIIPAEYEQNKTEYYNLILSITLNMDVEVSRIIQWFNFTDINPNIVVISQNESTLTFKDTLYLRFLSKLGFDIMIFVPTRYSSVENYLRSTEYETYDIGQAVYQLNLNNINVIENPSFVRDEPKKSSEKKGFFSRLLS